MTHTLRQLDQLLDAALDLPAEALPAFVDAECPAHLKERLEALLEIRDETVTAAPELAPGSTRLTLELAEAPRLATGDRLGPWRITDTLGRGGMGDVYLGERADVPGEPKVAIKVANKYDERIARHFETEREVLAALEHPNVVRLLDDGVTDDGRRYLVLELVDGDYIDLHCDARELSIDDRLRLFRDLGRAVEAVHGVGAVHRDLKPSNVLVSGEGDASPGRASAGHVKLLDFGIAKRLGPDAGAAGGGVEALTPDCASPEQFLGGPMTAATDVYQLGVLLYLLLTGERPYRLDGRHPAEVRRVVCEVEPQAPSARYADPAAAWDPQSVARAGARSTTVRGLRRRLAGELDRMVLKALDKDPARRYATVAELLEKIESHLGEAPPAFDLAA